MSGRPIGLRGSLKDENIELHIGYEYATVPTEKLIKSFENDKLIINLLNLQEIDTKIMDWIVTWDTNKAYLDNFILKENKLIKINRDSKWNLVFKSNIKGKLVNYGKFALIDKGIGYSLSGESPIVNIPKFVNFLYTYDEDAEIALNNLDKLIINSDAEIEDVLLSNSNIKEIIINGKQTYLGIQCFENCSHLETVVMPDTIEYIGMGCFENCTTLKEINLSNKLKSLQEFTFSGCSKLERIKLPEGLDAVRRNSFRGCNYLKELYIPNSVRIVENGSLPINTHAKIILPIRLINLVSEYKSAILEFY